MAGREPEERVSLPLLSQRWRDVAFLHWPFEPGALQSLLPTGLNVDVFDGKAWISLTPFVVEAARPPFIPPLSRLSAFPETNVRTYVRGPDGRDGLWFLTLEADSLLTVSSARMALGAPYRWADMNVDRAAGRVSYRSKRRGAPDIGHYITVTPGDSPVDADDALAHWLTGRWRAWTSIAGRLATVPVQHQRWPLTDARATGLEETLIAALGLQRPAGDALVHFAAGVDAKLGWPSFASRRHVSLHMSATWPSSVWSGSRATGAGAATQAPR